MKLIKAGYEVFMLYVYTDLQRSLMQNRIDLKGLQVKIEV